ncbi:mediator of RNA polymerase II transcription subunit 11-like isoform X2 [Pomacea canaliculata]|uniref:mediator of RNA polymerase II transcription subunit 11-like isoform X2 n=1 Tax=Pomacea canaliculata TaxID=400727 RepID=UPI000D72FC15|nr:mediator of RNA polymerase II transcription subunit 11-like isoform X2 [Pomacea canaliculata]
MASSVSHGPSRERLGALEKIEGNIASAIQSAGQALQELSKDKPILKHAEGHTTTFIKTLQEVENGLMQQITYLMQVTTGQPHEGSCYAAAKDLQMAMHRSEHVKSRLGELEKLKQEHLRMKHSGLVRGYSLPEQPR